MRLFHEYLERAAEWQCPDLSHNLANVAGLYHDVAKSTSYFHEYVGGKAPRTPEEQRLKSRSHLSSLLSLAAARAVAGNDFAPPCCAIAILRCHGDFDDSGRTLWRRLTRAVEEDAEILPRQSDAIEHAGVAARLSSRVAGFRYPESCDRFGLNITALRSFRLESPSPRMSMILNLLYSLLLTCDKQDAALEGATPTVIALNEARNELEASVRARRAPLPNAPVYPMAAPTDSRMALTKLETVLAFRARLPAEGRAGRIFYALPITSVVDQNFGVFEMILEPPPPTPLLKHHHLAEMGYSTCDDGPFYSAEAHGELLVESWCGGIVATTFVQDFESMFPNRTGMAKKVCAVGGAVQVLDKIQAIPGRLLGFVRDPLLTVCRLTDMRVILMTATQPLIFWSGEAVELASYPARFLRNPVISRMMLHGHWYEKIDIETLADRIASEPADKDLHVVIDTIRSSTELYERLRQDSQCSNSQFDYLLANVTPRPRRAPKSAPRLIGSTQVIEAGVDISADIAHRELASPDSRLQSYGRCNREGASVTGYIYVWPAFSHPVYAPILLDVMITAIGGMLAINESEFFDLGEDYYREVDRRVAMVNSATHGAGSGCAT